MIRSATYNITMMMNANQAIEKGKTMLTMKNLPAPTNWTRNGLPVCRTCSGTGKVDVPGFYDADECEDCEGSGIELSEIPAAIAFDDIPEFVEEFSAIPVCDNAWDEASSWSRKEGLSPEMTEEVVSVAMHCHSRNRAPRKAPASSAGLVEIRRVA